MRGFGLGLVMCIVLFGLYFIPDSSLKSVLYPILNSNLTCAL